jgi:hypothetical protein
MVGLVAARVSQTGQGNDCRFIHFPGDAPAPNFGSRSESVAVGIVCVT